MNQPSTLRHSKSHRSARERNFQAWAKRLNDDAIKESRKRMWAELRARLRDGLPIAIPGDAGFREWQP